LKKLVLLPSCLLPFLACAQQWLWGYPVSTDNGSSIEWVAADPSGNPYFLGWCSLSSTTLNGLNGPFPQTGLSTFVAKYDRAGNVTWVSGGWGSVEANHMAVDASGNTWLTGQYWGSAYFGIVPDTQQASAANVSDFFLARLDASGRATLLIDSGGHMQRHWPFVNGAREQ